MSIRDDIMTVEQVAAELQVDKKTVYRYAEAGHIPARRLGRRYIFSRAALTAWLQSPDARAS